MELQQVDPFAAEPGEGALDGFTRLPHPVLERIRAYGAEHGVPIVDALTGALLHGLTRAIGAAKVLEIGTAIGYSTVWMATALPPVPDKQNWHDIFYTARDGLRLHARHYRAAGSTRRPVLCLPGLTRNARDFHDLASILSSPPPVPQSRSPRLRAPESAPATGRKGMAPWAAELENKGRTPETGA